MKTKVLLIVVALSAMMFAQLPSTTVRVMNMTMPANNQVEWEVWLKNTSLDLVDFVGGQFHFSFNKLVLNGASSLTVVSSGLGTLAPKNPTVTTTTTPGQLRTAAPTPPGPGSGYQLAAGDSVKVATFRLTTTTSFNSANFDLVLRNSTAGNPFTKFGAYISSVNTEIQNASTYFQPENMLLPVELKSFVANTKGRDVKLDWKTATEINSSKFEVERSLVKENTPREWVKIGSVNAAGNSNSEKVYSFLDKKLNMGVFVYRLKIVDADGTFGYSNEVESTIDKPSTFDLSQNYPNPFNPSTKVDYQLPENALVTLDVYSISGEKIATLFSEQQDAGYYTYSINGNKISAGLASGIYIYRITADAKTPQGKFVSVKKMILMK